jgi:hypothetical protein
MIDTIEVRQNNLYQNGQLVSFSDGSQAVFRKILDIPTTVEDKYHPLATEESLDFLAWKYYQDEVEDPSKFWWAIADANDIIDPFDLSKHVGTEIRIPSITQVLLTA